MFIYKYFYTFEYNIINYYDMKHFYSLLFIFLFNFIFSQSDKLFFEYDLSGNQILRQYKNESVSQYVKGKSLHSSFKSLHKETYIYPNPVDTELIIGWEPAVSDLISKIELVPYNGTILDNIPFISREGKSVINMSNKLSGVYYIRIYLSDGRIINHSLIKN